MDFTREPIIESVITPRDGCKLIVRSCKHAAQEEYFLDSLEIVSFGNSFFYRSLEKPKSFLVPVSDYEVTEARETRVVLKTASPERGAIRIGGKKEDEGKQEQQKLEKSRRRSNRRRRGKEELEQEVKEQPHQQPEEEVVEKPKEKASKPAKEKSKKEAPQQTVSSLLPPPKTLIRDSIERYRNDEKFAQAFFSDEDVENKAENEIIVVSEEQSPEAIVVSHETEDFSASVSEEETQRPFGEGDGFSELSGEEEKSEINSFVPDDSHWIIPELPVSKTPEVSEAKEVLEKSEVAEETSKETSSKE